MNNVNDPMFRRNYGFFNQNEQQKLIDSKVSIAGVGGDGFQLGEKLARMGVSKFVVADPEVFEAENVNRVTGAKHSTLGRNKAEVFSELVHDIHPDADVTVYTEGVSEDNVESFVKDSDLVIDESELTTLEIGTMIARKSRENDKPVLLVMNIGFAAISTSFAKNRSRTFEDIMGIPKNMPIDEVKDLNVDFSRCLPYLPRYGDYGTLLEVTKGAPLPSITQGVDVASALGSTEAFFHLTRQIDNKRPNPTWAPKWRYIDAYAGKAGEIRHARLAYYLGALAIYGRTKLGLNPSTSYDQESRKMRGE